MSTRTEVKDGTGNVLYVRDPLMDWIEAFCLAQAEFPPIGKDTSVTVKMKEGGSFSYKYATLPDILDAIAPGLDANGLSISQSVTGDGTTVAVETRIYHKAGHVEVFGPLALRVAGDAKAAGSSITYARRYALCAALGIAPDEDDDGARASEPKPVRTDVEIDPAQWLSTAVEAFGLWTPDEKKKAGAAAMKDLGYKNPLTRLQAEQVFASMTAAYYEAFPDTIPF